MPQSGREKIANLFVSDVPPHKDNPIVFYGDCLYRYGIANCLDYVIH